MQSNTIVNVVMASLTVSVISYLAFYFFRKRKKSIHSQNSDDSLPTLVILYSTQSGTSKKFAEDLAFLCKTGNFQIQLVNTSAYDPEDLFSAVSFVWKLHDVCVDLCRIKANSRTISLSCLSLQFRLKRTVNLLPMDNFSVNLSTKQLVVRWKMWSIPNSFFSGILLVVLCETIS